MQISTLPPFQIPHSTFNIMTTWRNPTGLRHASSMFTSIFIHGLFASLLFHSYVYGLAIAGGYHIAVGSICRIGHILYHAFYIRIFKLQTGVTAGSLRR